MKRQIFARSFRVENVAMERDWKRMIYDGERVSFEQHVANCIRTRKSMLDSWGYSSSGIWTDVDNNRVRFKNRGWRSACVVVLSIGSNRPSLLLKSRNDPLSTDGHFAPWRKRQTSFPFTNSKYVSCSLLALFFYFQQFSTFYFSIF